MSANRSFMFVTYTGKPDVEAKRELPKVREHVMHDHFWKNGRKSRGKKKGGATRDPRSRHSIVGSEKACHYYAQDEQDEEEPKKVDRRDLRSTLSSGSSTALVSFGSQSPYNNSTLHNMDPFDALPITDVGRGTGDLIQWYLLSSDTRTRINGRVPIIVQSNIWSKQSFWDMAMESKGLFHVLLSIAESREEATTGRVVSANHYYHNLQAIHEIQNALQGNKPKNSPALLMLISTQLARALADQDYESARLHMTAVCTILRENWPCMFSKPEDTYASSITCPPELARSFAFNHFVYNSNRLALLTNDSPFLPIYKPRVPVPPPDAMDAEALKRTMVTMLHLPPFPYSESFVRAAISMIHQLSLIRVAEYAGDMMGYPMQVFLTAPHFLCTMSADLSLTDDTNTNLVPVKAIVLCSQIFYLNCIPTSSPNPTYPSVEARIHVTVLQRLIKVLEPHAKDLCTEFLRSGASLESLLWVAFIGSVESCSDNCQNADRDTQNFALTLFLKTIEEAVDRLCIRTAADLEGVLRCFPWLEGETNVYCSTLCTLLGLGPVPVGKNGFEVVLNAPLFLKTMRSVEKAVMRIEHNVQYPI